MSRTRETTNHGNHDDASELGSDLGSDVSGEKADADLWNQIATGCSEQPEDAEPEPQCNPVQTNGNEILLFDAELARIQTFCNFELCSNSTLGQQIQNQVWKRKRSEQQPMPWDNLFGKAKLPFECNHHPLPLVGRFDGKITKQDANSSTSPEDALRDPKFHFASKRLMAAKMVRSDDELRVSAMRKLRNIVLVKRVSDYNRFSLWQVHERHHRPLNPTEEDFFQYVQHLQETGSGPTAAAAFLKSWGFMKSVAGAGWKINQDLFSGRVRGVVQKAFAGKRSLLQAPPIPVPIRSENGRLCVFQR